MQETTQVTEYITLKEFARLHEMSAQNLLFYRDTFPPVYKVAGRKCYLQQDAIAWNKPEKKKTGPKVKQ